MVFSTVESLPFSPLLTSSLSIRRHPVTAQTNYGSLGCVFSTVNTINQHVIYTFFVQFHNAFIIHTVWLSQKPITPRHICFWWNVHCVYFRNACTGCSERRIKQSIWLFRLSKHTQMHIISSIIYFLRRQLEEQTHWTALIVFEYSKVNLSSRGNKVQLLSYS